jgi:uncharacterized cupin superfamily protein
MADPVRPIVNQDELAEQHFAHGEHFESHDKGLTPSMRARGGRLGVNLTRVPPGRTACPFHSHQLEDEVFYVLSGTGVLRYGDALHPLRAGDCVSCPAGTRSAHQIANTGTTDLVYLAVGNHEPQEVCVYPDSGKILVRGLEQLGHLTKADYFDAEPTAPRIFELAADKGR